VSIRVKVVALEHFLDKDHGMLPAEDDIELVENEKAQDYFNNNGDARADISLVALLSFVSEFNFRAEDVLMAENVLEFMEPLIFLAPECNHLLSGLFLLRM
jgi:hypothetical protein